VKKNPVYRSGGREAEKRSKKSIDEGDQISFGTKYFFIIINIYRYIHVKMISAKIETSIKIKFFKKTRSSSFNLIFLC